MIFLLASTAATPPVFAFASALLVLALGVSATKIEWAENVWNPSTGCHKVSPGCRLCYMFTEVENRLQGKVRGKYAHGTHLVLHPTTLRDMASESTPSKVFVNSMSDAFHEAVPDEYVFELFEAMAEAPWHSYMLLTKRAERLAEFGPYLPWADHVMMGVTVDNGDSVHRLDLLRASEAPRTFVSFEPLIGSVLDENGEVDLTGIDLAIVGGESSKHTPGEKDATRMKAEWAREIREACAAQDVPLHFKQWGAYDADGKLVGTKKAGRVLDGRTHDAEPTWFPDFMREAGLRAAAHRAA